jgi:Flp pilus assembly pilin Flp
MRKIIEKVRGQGSLLRDERGLSTVEYVIILVLIAAAAIGLWVKFGETLQAKIGDAQKELDTEVVIEKGDSQ